MNFTIDPALVAAFLAAFAGIATWGLTEWSKRNDQKNQQKDERYRKLIEALSGYYEPGDPELRKKFINELNQCWLYCPDDVIRIATEFFNEANKDSDAKNKAASDLLLAIRKDTQFKETTLKSDDFINKSLRIVSLKGEIVTKTVVKAKPQNNKCPQHEKRCRYQFWK